MTSSGTASSGVGARGVQSEKRELVMVFGLGRVKCWANLFCGDVAYVGAGGMREAGVCV